MSAANDDEQALAERVVSRDDGAATRSASGWASSSSTCGRARATVRMTVRDDMVNGFGVCHGGVAVLARRQRARVCIATRTAA